MRDLSTPIGLPMFELPTAEVTTPPEPGGGGTPTRCPFDITVTGTTVTFEPGTINSLLPSNYATGVTIPAMGTRYLVLNCTAANGEITAASFSVESSVPPAIAPYAGEPPVTFGIVIGVVVDSVAVKVWGCGNIQAIGEESFRLQKVSPTAGELPYDVYYTWDISLIG
jgi:hypothetical protein